MIGIPLKPVGTLKLNPLIKFKKNSIENSYKDWKSFIEEEFQNLKSNEIMLNEIFIDIYNIEEDIISLY